MKSSQTSILFFALLLGCFGMVKSQCVVDPQYTSPGIYPSDTLLDMFATQSTNQVVQFVFPPDTVLFGQTLPFDSFVVSGVTNIPANLQWECNNNHPTCTYVTTPGQLTRGCVTISDIPQAQNAAYPGYDSIIVNGTAWVTLLGNAYPISTDIPIFYRIGLVGIDAGMFSSLDFDIAPNPVAFRSTASFNLEAAADIKLTIVDMVGKEVRVVSEGMMNAGTHNVKIDASQLPAGAYFLKVEINNGDYSESKKFMAIH